ncbi:MAG: hypothetical protein H0U49_00785 [Parachlamydiaceae bacterium]|nr:hypothetical protein [Parachlamydiaceae bacterium]
MIERPGREGQYTTYNGDGAYKQYRGSGKSHGKEPRPNIKETYLNPIRDGNFKPGKPHIRGPETHEIPSQR